MNFQDDYVNIVKSLRKRDKRLATGLTIAEGYLEVTRAIKAGVPIEVIYICPEILPDIAFELFEQNVRELSKAEFARIAFGHRLKGVLAICRPVNLELSDLNLGTNPFILVIEGVEKPGNIGTVIRMADGAGVDAVIMADNRTDVYNHNTVRASIGTVFSVPVVAISTAVAVEFCLDKKIPIFAATAKAQVNYTECDLSGPVVIAIGNEHDGLSRPWLDHAREKIMIPMAGMAGCLNAAMSASIITYEAVRQRGACKNVSVNVS